MPDALPFPVKAIRYYLPVEICSHAGGVGLYHYCCHVYPGDKVWPVGYCSRGCPGHPSKAEAREHYRQFLIDRFGQYAGRFNSSGVCAVCRRETVCFACIEYHFEWEPVALCPDHLNREGLASSFVLRDYHLLQLSDPHSLLIVTVTGSGGPVSVVSPQDPGCLC
jgi:hypothetical protein